MSPVIPLLGMCPTGHQRGQRPPTPRCTKRLCMGKPGHPQPPEPSALRGAPAGLAPDPGFLGLYLPYEACICTSWPIPGFWVSTTESQEVSLFSVPPKLRTIAPDKLECIHTMGPGFQLTRLMEISRERWSWPGLLRPPW